jgi:hypothetical protein
MLVTATRRYLQEGSFIVQYYEGAPTKKGYLFLFSDAMLLGSPAGGLSSKIKPKRFLLLGTRSLGTFVHASCIPPLTPGYS